MKHTVSSSLSKKVKQLCLTNTRGWDEAIKETECRIEGHRARMELLAISLERFKEFRDRGEPWPGGYGSAEEVLGQTGLLGQSRATGQ